MHECAKKKVGKIYRKEIWKPLNDAVFLRHSRQLKGARQEKQEGERILLYAKTVVVPQSAAQRGDEINK